MTHAIAMLLGASGRLAVVGVPVSRELYSFYSREYASEN